MSRAIQILSLFFLLFTSSLHSQSNIKTLGILNLESANVAEVTVADARTLTNRLHTEISKTGRFQVVEMQKVDDILREQGLQQTGSCASDQCVAEVGQLLGVEWMLTGYIGYIGHTYSIDVRIIEVKTRKIVETAFENYRGQSEGLLDVMKSIATKLSFPSSSQAPVGALRITSQPSDAVVLINSTEAGRTPLTVNDLAPGDYTIQGKLDGYLHRSLTVQVNPGRIEQVDLRLSKICILKISSAPNGARLILNGREMGITPFSGPVLTGSYQAELNLNGYAPWKEVIKIDTDYSRQVNLIKFAEFAPQAAKDKGKKKWPWYVAGVCLAGGTAAAILLKVDSENTGTIHVIIPKNP